MRHILTCLICLLLFSTSALSNDRGTPWLISWPFFQNAQAPHSIQSGYGDWCIYMEGAHPGLDFGAILKDPVLLPTDDTRYTLGTYSGLGYTMIFGVNSTSQEGWGVAHLAIRNTNICPFLPGSMVMNHEP